MEGSNGIIDNLIDDDFEFVFAAIENALLVPFSLALAGSFLKVCEFVLNGFKGAGYSLFVNFDFEDGI